jgi:long-chain acyl-CoA synthetase
MLRGRRGSMTGSTEPHPWLRLHPTGYPAHLEAPDMTALDMFERSARRYPDRPAIHYFERTLTWGDVDRAADSFAVALRELGVVKGDRVIVQLQNVPQFVIAVVGCWKAGATVVPLNPMYRENELAFYCRDSGARVFVTLESCAAEARGGIVGTEVRHLITTSELDYLDPASCLSPLLRDSVRQSVVGGMDMLALIAKFQGRALPTSRLTPDDIAYITYTSGTTGSPKGAMNTHGNVSYAATAFVTAYGVTQDDRILAMPPFIHVTGSICLLAVAMVTGAPVIACFRFDAGEVLRLIESWRATYTNGPLTAYIALLNHPAIRERDLSSFTKVLSGGAPVAPRVAAEFAEVTGTYLHNTYGLTETTSPGLLTPMGVRGPIDPETGALSVGFPPPGATAKIVDLETGADLPPGQVGEVAIKGPMVVPGYWQRPDESAHAIRDGWLFTGDVGKMDPEGWFYIVDRKKDLIIVSGFKVWPREVEDVLYQHPAVASACVIGVPDDYRGETVKAYITLRTGSASSSPDEFIDFCRQRMAAYKYPRLVEIVDEIPKTASGKMLKRQLRDRETKRHS